MSARRDPRGTAALPLLHWLVLVGGLAICTALRIDEPEKTLPLWMGGVLGTALGQLFAWCRLRPWLAAFLAVNAMWVGTFVMWPFLTGIGEPWAVLQAYAPAVLCGYLSLSERGTLAAFWFPAVLWSLSILDVDSTGRATLGGTTSWLLLGGLAALLLSTLWAREGRRVAQWTTHPAERLAQPARRTVLREAPLRDLARLGWTSALGATTLLVTAWIAPHLRQVETFVSPGASAGAASSAAGAGGAQASCCPEPPVAEVKRARVREYFSPLQQRAIDAVPAVPVSCVPCRQGAPDGAAASVPPERGLGAAAGDGVASTSSPAAPGGEPAPGGPTTTPPPPAPAAQPPRALPPTGETPVSAAPGARTPPPVVAPPVEPPTRVARPVVSPAPSLPVAGVAPIAPPPPGAAPRARAEDGHLLEWTLALSFAGLGLHFGLRPLRRWITLRHLQRPFWPESVDQRVSNLWQLMLVGLRDAGWRALPGEQPQELARRVGVEGTATCAAVLDRARHGARVDAADLEAMDAAARTAYAGARRRVGWAARGAAWWRWPLA